MIEFPFKFVFYFTKKTSLNKGLYPIPYFFFDSYSLKNFNLFQQISENILLLINIALDLKNTFMSSSLLIKTVILIQNYTENNRHFIIVLFIYNLIGRNNEINSETLYYKGFPRGSLGSRLVLF